MSGLGWTLLFEIEKKSFFPVTAMEKLNHWLVAIAKIN